MKKNIVLLLLIIILLSGCSIAEKWQEDIFTHHIYADIVTDNSTEYGVATVPAGDSYVVIYHNLGAIPINVQLTRFSNAGVTLNFDVKNPTATQFAIELDGTSASDQRFYWMARR